MMKRLVFGLTALAALAAPGPAQAQLGRIPIEITSLVETDGAHAGTTARAAFEVRLPSRYHVNSNKPLEDSLIPTALTLQPPDGIRVREIVYPEATSLAQEGSDQPLAVFEAQFVIGVALEIGPGVPAGEHVVPGRLRYQACDDKVCYMPATADVELRLPVVPAGQTLSPQHARLFSTIAFGTGDTGESDPPAPAPAPLGPNDRDDAGVLPLLQDFTILSAAGGYMNSRDFLQFVTDAEQGRRQPGFFENRGPLAILAIVLLGGLALNLTPCVLPMIPINLAIIGAGARAGSRLRGFFLGGAYGAAMALVYGVLGLAVILTAGTFGTINASPWFNLAIAALFVVLGLAMFDVLMIDFSRFQSKFGSIGGGRGSFVAAFGMGAVAALLAGACVAPVVIQVVVFSSELYASGLWIALLLPFFLGIGMAFPWPLAGAGLASLPKPGPWMVRVKQAFGVFILATAAYYGYVAYEIFDSRRVDSAAVASSVQEKISEGWYASLRQGLEAARAENKLVMVDLWATWCKNCLTMDKTTFKDPAVTARLENFVKIKFQAEDPSSSPAQEVMRHLDAVGLPTYAILRPIAADASAGGAPAGNALP
jgi:thiol:disulfide interchange protein DsbD